MSDIAVKAGVSQSTVSFVLNDRHTSVRISEETRQRVLAAAEELGYRTNHMARAVRTGNTQMLGFIGGDLREEQVGCMLAGALDEADQNGYTLKILPHHDREDDAQQMIRRSSELRLMGVVALHLPAWMLEQLYAEAQQCKYPLVLMDSRAPLKGVYQVASDDEQGVGMAIDHLVGLGHRKIAMMSSDLISPLIPLREVAYRTAMKRHGLTVPEQYVARGDFRLHDPSEKAAQALLQLPQEQRPTAIFCAGDLMALVALQVASRLRVLVPEQLSIIGFANLKITEFSNPPLTTVQQPFQEMGRMSVRRLLASFHNEEVTGSGKKPHNAQDPENALQVLPTCLIERGSTSTAPV